MGSLSCVQRKGGRGVEAIVRGNKSSPYMMVKNGK